MLVTRGLDLVRDRDRDTYRAAAGALVARARRGAHAPAGGGIRPEEAKGRPGDPPGRGAPALQAGRAIETRADRRCPLRQRGAHPRPHSASRRPSDGALHGDGTPDSTPRQRPRCLAPRDWPAGDP